MTRSEATAQGYIVQVLIEGDYETHEALVKPETDYDDIFTFYSLETDTLTRCHGYNCTINTLSVAGVEEA